MSLLICNRMIHFCDNSISNLVRSCLGYKKPSQHLFLPFFFFITSPESIIKTARFAISIIPINHSFLTTYLPAPNILHYQSWPNAANFPLSGSKAEVADRASSPA